MSKILVNSLRFGVSDMGRGERFVSAIYNNGTAIFWARNTGTLQLHNSKLSGKLTRTEEALALLVLRACATYLDNGEPEHMSYAECDAAFALAVNRFNWEAAGYDPNGTDDDKNITLAGYIANFQDI